MTDPLAPSDLERRLRAALARRATRDDGATTDDIDIDIDIDIDDLGRRIGASADAVSRPDPALAVAAAPRSTGDTVIPLPAMPDRPNRRSCARLMAAACVVAVLAIGAVGLAGIMSDRRSAPLGVSAVEVPTGSPGGSDVLTVAITTGPFAGMGAEVSPTSYQVPGDATEVTVTAVLTNPTNATIEGPGCALDNSRYGLADADAAAPELWMEVFASCAVERSRHEPGSRTPIAWTLAFSEAQQASDDTEYRAVIEAGDDALHIEVPVRVDRGPRTATVVPTTTASLTTTEPADPGKPGDAVDGTLVVRNPTDHDVAFTECTELATTSGLVPADQPDAELPRNVIRDCYATERHSAKAGRTTRIPLLRRIVARTPTPGSLSGYGGDLPAGAYLAVVEIPGRTSTVRLTLPVTLDPSDCPGRTTALVARYAGLTRAQAKDLAAAEGRTTRVSAIDGRDLAVEADLRCDRVNLDLSGGRVMDISLG